MPELSTSSLAQVTDLAIHWGANGAWALVTLVVGWILAGWAERAVKAGLARVRVADQMLRGFFGSLVRWALLAVTGIAVLERQDLKYGHHKVSELLLDHPYSSERAANLEARTRFDPKPKGDIVAPGWDVLKAAYPTPAEWRNT